MDGSSTHQLQSDPSKMSANLSKRRSLQNIDAALPSLSINKNKKPSIVSQEMSEAQIEAENAGGKGEALLHSSVMVFFTISTIKRSNASNLF